MCASNLTHRLSTHLPLYYGLNESHSSRASSLKQHSDTKPHSWRRMCKKHTRKNVNMQILKSQQKSVLLWKFMLKSVHLIRNNISFYVTTTATETFFCIDNTVIHMQGGEGPLFPNISPAYGLVALHRVLLSSFKFFYLVYMCTYTYTNYDTQ